MSSSNCCFLTCIQISQEAGQVVCYFSLFQNFPQFVVIHTIRGFGIVNKAKVNVFLEHSCFFDDPTDVGNLISGSSAFSKSSLNIWKFTVHVLLKPGLENFEHYFASVWHECNCVVVWTFFGFRMLIKEKKSSALNQIKYSRYFTVGTCSWNFGVFLLLLQPGWGALTPFFMILPLQSPLLGSPISSRPGLSLRCSEAWCWRNPGLLLFLALPPPSCSSFLAPGHLGSQLLPLPESFSYSLKTMLTFHFLCWQPLLAQASTCP